MASQTQALEGRQDLTAANYQGLTPLANDGRLLRGLNRPGFSISRGLRPWLTTVAPYGAEQKRPVSSRREAQHSPA